ncbi:hypothetical protein LXL04_005856 [Taraxacum kok-saghyz]
MDIYLFSNNIFAVLVFAKHRYKKRMTSKTATKEYKVALPGLCTPYRSSNLRLPPAVVGEASCRRCSSARGHSLPHCSLRLDCTEWGSQKAAMIDGLAVSLQGTKNVAAIGNSIVLGPPVVWKPTFDGRGWRVKWAVEGGGHESRELGLSRISNDIIAPGLSTQRIYHLTKPTSNLPVPNTMGQKRSKNKC